MDEIINPKNLSLSPEQIAWLLPYLIVGAGGMVSLLLGVMKNVNRNLISAGAAVITVVAAIYAISMTWGEPGMTLFNGMLAVDYYGSFINVILLVATGFVLILSYPYLEKERIHHAEYYSLALFSCLGMMLLASALDLIVLFVALEIMSIGVYVLVGFRRTDVRSNEAAVKYYVLGSAASAILLYGIAMIYGSTGTMNLREISAFLTSHPASNSLFVLGAVLVVVGFLFKVAAVPFHMWMPDVYEGAPTSVTNFMTTGLKAAAFASFLRVFIALGNGQQTIATVLSVNFHNVLWVIAVITMFFGNIIALTQKNMKRMLAYSSISHTGYILVGLISGANSEYGFSAVLMYLAAYVIMNIGAFAVVGLLAEQGDSRTNIEDYAGLGFKHPALGFAMAVFMFSMAGIPPTAGFAGKYLIFSSAVQAGEIWLAVLAVLCSAISAYYYLRVIVVMYMKEPGQERIAFTLSESVVIALATLATLQVGLFPSLLISAAKKAMMNI